MPRALVIGGRRGIGAAVVQALAAQGMDVTYTYRTAFDDAAATARQLDLADCAAVDAFAREQEEASAWDAFVQVSGTTYDTLATVMDQDAAEHTMQVNYWAFVRIARAVVRPMLRARSGRIVVIGSVMATRRLTQFRRRVKEARMLRQGKSIGHAGDEIGNLARPGRGRICRSRPSFRRRRLGL